MSLDLGSRKPRRDESRSSRGFLWTTLKLFGHYDESLFNPCEARGDREAGRLREIRVGRSKRCRGACGILDDLMRQPASPFR